ncbi:restriction endonuclease subunit S [Mucilaginibacter defluvii]|uniref:Type I restriction modification DNA specificity domain-containing protein n=1 Tax=Mucilaginibacter defluvii TaxID=1196019 RepID=A0ABP9G1H0_9SPHI
MSFDEWNKVTIESLVDENRGISYGIVQPGEFINSGGIPILKVNNLTERRFDLKDVSQVKPEIESKYSRTRLQGNEILVSLVGSLGFVFKVTNQQIGWNVVRAIGVLPIKEGINRDFIYWALKQPHVQKAFDYYATHTVQSTLNLKELREIQISLPSGNIQNQIATILSSLDDKIENNLATNQTLEEITCALFKEWFVNFNYPGADGNLKHSEVGDIPVSWEVGSLFDIADQVRENINPSKYPEKEFYHYSLPAFDTDELPSKDLGSNILSNKTAVKAYSVLFSKLNPRIPRIWSIGTIDEDSSVCSTEFIGFVPKRKYYYSYLNYLLKQPELIRKLTNIATGTSNSHQRIKPTDLFELEILIPDDEILKSFEKTVRPILETRFHKIIENQQLAATRNSLLPKLMSGEIKVNGY